MWAGATLSTRNIMKICSSFCSKDLGCILIWVGRSLLCHHFTEKCQKINFLGLGGDFAKPLYGLAKPIIWCFIKEK
jgi:hypothetical protein